MFISSVDVLTPKKRSIVSRNGLTVPILSEIIDEINSCSVIAVDLNLSDDVLEYIVHNSSTKIICDATSIMKCRRIIGITHLINVLCANYQEACLIAGVSNNTPNIVLINKLRELGINKFFITLGSEGAIAVHNNKKLWYHVSTIHTEITLGAGDAFVSGIIYGEVKKSDLSDMLEYGLLCAYYKLVGEQTYKVEKLHQELYELKIISKRSSWDETLQKWVEV